MGVWLDTAIGLVLFFLAMSLVVTAAVEALSQVMSWRANTLRAGIESLLHSFSDGTGNRLLLARFYDHTLVKSLSDQRGLGFLDSIGTGKKPSYIPARVFAAVLVDIATRNGPAQDLRDNLAAWRAASEDPAAWQALGAAFAAAAADAGRLQTREQTLLLDMDADKAAFTAAIAETKQLAGAIAAAAAVLARPPVQDGGFAAHEATALQLCDLLERLSGMVDRSLAGAEEFAARLEHPALHRLVKGALGTTRASLDEVRATIARSFDDSMQRVSGWYKRRTQAATFLIALGAAVLANASAFQATIVIHDDTSLRTGLVVAAQNLSRQSDDETRNKEIIDKLSSMPIGWGNAERFTTDGRCEPASGGGQKPVCKPWYEHMSIWSFLRLLFLYPLGWLVTALATMIGAPFWFDVLSTLMRLRASGPMPAATERRDSAAS